MDPRLYKDDGKDDAEIEEIEEDEEEEEDDEEEQEEDEKAAAVAEAVGTVLANEEMKELLDMGPAQRQFWKRWSTVGPLLADLDLISGLREALEKAKATVALKKFRGKTWYFVASAELPGTSGQNADEKLRASIRSQDTNRVLEHRMRPEKGDRSQTRGYLLASDFFGDLANISEETTKALLDPQWAKARAIVSGEDVDSDDEAAAQRWVATVEARLAAGEGSSGPVSKKARIEKRTAEEEALAPFGTPAEILDEPKDMLAVSNVLRRVTFASRWAHSAAGTNNHEQLAVLRQSAKAPHHRRERCSLVFG